MQANPQRRNFLKLSLGSAAGMLALGGPLSRAVAAGCGLTTAPQTEGPFYPGEEQFGHDTDLTRVRGRSARALGQVVLIKGKVVDQNCRPVEGASVEIWQACASGRYNHARDPNPAPIDPNFRYWAEAVTDAEGNYHFKTIIPAAYQASADWRRPPHIHFKVARLGYRELTTQMYFKGETLNDRDLILQDLPPEDRDGVIVEFSPTQEEAGALAGSFDITLRALRA